MRYESTRGGVSGIAFKDTVMMGLAADGGLLVPTSIPQIQDQLLNWQHLSYTELAFNIMSLYIDDIEASALKDIIDRSYSNFDDPKVTPVRKVGDIFILELFHGPTLAFKDIALQFLGNMFEHVLEERQTAVNILGATSGDTGSAAIAGIRGKENINIYIMFPEGKTSPVQELQMTSVLDANVHNIGIEGSFDDCQLLMKSAFTDLAFKEKYNLAAVNSVNWTRVLAQVVYYFSAYYQMGMPKNFDVCVPTGNFGNVFAAYIAREMGLPIRKLVLATNDNDILARFFESGVYTRGDVHFTHSPAMDIQVASNFERYLYFKLNKNSDKVKDFVDGFLKTGQATLPSDLLDNNADICASSVSDPETLSTIRNYHEEHAYLIDPHTAVGLSVAAREKQSDMPMLSLSTAHPAKFDNVMVEALGAIVKDKVYHPSLDALKDKPTRKIVLPAELSKIKAIIAAE